MESAFSPDGSHLVFVGSGDDGTQLYVRPLNEVDAVPLRGTEGASQPFFSPDGKWVGFFAGRKLKKVLLAGGPALVIADVPGPPRGASWGPNDDIFGAWLGASGVFRVSSEVGTPESVTTTDREKGDGFHYWPEVLPGGRAFLFSSGRSEGSQNLEVQSPWDRRTQGSRSRRSEPALRFQWTPDFLARKGFVRRPIRSRQAPDLWRPPPRARKLARDSGRFCPAQSLPKRVSRLHGRREIGAWAGHNGCRRSRRHGEPTDERRKAFAACATPVSRWKDTGPPYQHSQRVGRRPTLARRRCSRDLQPVHARAHLWRNLVP